MEPAEVESLLEKMVDEVQGDYYDAVKLSMVEYVLRSSEEGRCVVRPQWSRGMSCEICRAG